MPENPSFDVAAITREASDALTVRRAFGEAYESHGSTVIPVAKVFGTSGAGSGSGYGPHAESAGPPPGASGGGAGSVLHVRPIGVYVIDAAGVHWKPTFDLGRAVLGGQIVGAVLGSGLAMWLTVRSLRRRR